jgi:plastocyanin domain-containing protein
MVKITVGEGGFSPSSVTVSKGQKLMLMLTRVTDNTCAKKVVFPELGL